MEQGRIERGDEVAGNGTAHEGKRGLPVCELRVAAFSLVSGALPGDLIRASIPAQANNRGLYAATRFESSKGVRATFVLTGTSKAAWLNGQMIKPGATFTSSAKPGLNVIVLQLDEKNLPAELALRSPDVTFLKN